MLRTQNNAPTSYYFTSAVNNNNKTNSYLAIPFYEMKHKDMIYCVNMKKIVKFKK
jgi:hypothetical protein